MKSKLIITLVTILMAVAFTSLLAEEASEHVTKAEKRLFKTDLNILFKQYERAATQLGDLNFQMGLAAAVHTATTDEKREMQEQQRNFLMQQVDVLRTKIIEMGKKADKMQLPKQNGESKKKA